MKKCFLCGKNFDISQMVTITKNLSNKVIPSTLVCDRCFEDHGYGHVSHLSKIDRIGSHSSSISSLDPRQGGRTERNLVDREVPVDNRVRRIMEMKQEVSTLETLLASAVNQDTGAMRARISELKLRIQMETTLQNPQNTDRAGRLV